MINFKLYEVVAYSVNYPEDLAEFTLTIDQDTYDLKTKDLARLRWILLERFPITEKETREFDKKRALELVENA